jgi:predicted DNA-binding protein
MDREQKVVGFRVAPEFDRQLRVMAALSGYPHKSALIREAVSEKLAELTEALGEQPLTCAEPRAPEGEKR